MLVKDGVATKEQVYTRYPAHELLIKPKAIIECYESIPCNPCSTSCPFGAITIGDDINNLPKVDFDKCTGCGVCVYSCPGLAIMVCEIFENKARFKIPYEFLPYPKENEVWHAVNRKGEVIGDALIEKVTLTKRQDRTVLVQVLVDEILLYDFVTIRRKL
ncbi:4Fe-4S binding protein [Mycoplasmatota bacterium]|nr:4Fe-4S binding protein [Mycoplasmatota bacterium]